MPRSSQPDATAPSVAGADGWSRRARRSPGARAARGRRQRAHRLRRGRVRPSLAVVGGLRLREPEPAIFPREDEWKPSWDIGVNVNWSLWNGGRTAAEVAEARSQATAAQEQLAELDSQHRPRGPPAAARPRLRARAGAGCTGRRQECRRGAAGRAGAIHRGRGHEYRPARRAAGRLEAELQRTRALANVRLAEARLARALGNDAPPELKLGPY